MARRRGNPTSAILNIDPVVITDALTESNRQIADQLAEGILSAVGSSLSEAVSRLVGSVDQSIKPVGTQLDSLVEALKAHENFRNVADDGAQRVFGQGNGSIDDQLEKIVTTIDEVTDSFKDFFTRMDEYFKTTQSGRPQQGDQRGTEILDGNGRVIHTVLPAATVNGQPQTQSTGEQQGASNQAPAPGDSQPNNSGNNAAGLTQWLLGLLPRGVSQSQLMSALLRNSYVSGNIDLMLVNRIKSFLTQTVSQAFARASEDYTAGNEWGMSTGEGYEEGARYASLSRVLSTTSLGERGKEAVQLTLNSGLKGDQALQAATLVGDTTFGTGIDVKQVAQMMREAVVAAGGSMTTLREELYKLAGAAASSKASVEGLATVYSGTLTQAAGVGYGTASPEVATILTRVAGAMPTLTDSERQSLTSGFTNETTLRILSSRRQMSLNDYLNKLEPEEQVADYFSYMQERTQNAPDNFVLSTLFKSMGIEATPNSAATLKERIGSVATPEGMRKFQQEMDVQSKTPVMKKVSESASPRVSSFFSNLKHTATAGVESLGFGTEADVQANLQQANWQHMIGVLTQLNATEIPTELWSFLQTNSPDDNTRLTAEGLTGVPGSKEYNAQLAQLLRTGQYDKLQYRYIHAGGTDTTRSLSDLMKESTKETAASQASSHLDSRTSVQIDLTDEAKKYFKTSVITEDKQRQQGTLTGAPPQLPRTPGVNP